MTEREKWKRYRSGGGPIPERQWLWPLYGAGFERLGVDDQPIQAPVPEPRPDQLLVRHDAVGICFSDVKIIRQGGEHPRLVGRDLEKEPVVMGHEVALTVVGVGENLRDQYRVGDRFAVQADIYYKGQNLAYGYRLQGGYSQYALVGEEILHGDEGCYLLPIPEGLGYSEAALTEPWACVEAAYVIQYRTRLKPGGTAWFLGGSPDGPRYTLSRGLDAAAHPARIVLSDVPITLRDELTDRAETLGIEVVTLDGLSPEQYERAREHTGGAGFDDIIILGPIAPEAVEAAARHLARGGILNVVSPEPFSRPVALDVGRLHYEHITFVGSPGPDIAASYGSIRSELKPGGCALFVGAAGPMGHMHVQRALQLAERPSVVVATNLRSPRIHELAAKFEQLAQRQGVKLHTYSQGNFTPEAFAEEMKIVTGGHGFDDVIICAASAEGLTDLVALAADGAVVNLFAGLPRGTLARLDLNAIIQRGVRYVGSSGSSIDDMHRVMEKAAAGQLSPDGSVAAVAGLRAVKEGLQAVAEGRFPGKIVIYPQILDFPLTPLSELGERLPEVARHLEDGGRTWTRAAEIAFLEALLP
ncbi:MAG TPA: alcohol dehydrogenase catalytic domain-containing protein [Caldilineae bacterium]|nr:alcohol dehydrogenase catalytic domain-containing protein [Caldilineae bacterium]